MPVDRWQPRLSNSAAMADWFIRAVRATTCASDLALLMEAVTAEMGFRHYALIHHADLRGTPSGCVDIRQYPDVVAERIFSGAGYRRDPVIRACAFAEAAFLWSELGRIITLDRRDLLQLEFGASAGLNEGITVPCVLLGDCMGSCTFAGTNRPDCAARFLGVAQMIGVFAFQAARRLILDTGSPAPVPRLHPRPRDCIVLLGKGFSNKEIARALGITPRTVDGYLTEARQLFEARDRTELLVAAIFAGEVSLHELKHPGS